MPTYKLTYFNLKGKGETIRLSFHAAGIPFEDKRIEFAEWPALKPTIFTGQLPMLEVDGKQLSESMSIARFIAREGNLLGGSSFESAKVEAVTDAVEVLLNHMAKYKWCDNPVVKEALLKDLEEKHFPGVIKLLEDTLADKQYFVTHKLSLAEIHFFSVFSNILEFAGYEWQAKTPKLKALYERVQKEPKLAAYLKTQKA